MLFLPLWDVNNPVKHIPFQYVTVSLIVVNIAVYLLFQAGMLIPVGDEAIINFALVPANLFSGGLLGAGQTVVAVEDTVAVPSRLTLITYMFLHGNLLHLGGNMLFLWVFGDNVEDAMGHLRFLFFYLLCGIFAGLTHALLAPNSQIPLIGASGAVAGVLAAYLMLHPNVRLWVLVLFRIPLRISAGLALGVWIALQVVNVFTDADGTTAWWAHIGGLVAGAVLVLFMRRPGVPLFDRSRGVS